MHTAVGRAVDADADADADAAVGSAQAGQETSSAVLDRFVTKDVRELDQRRCWNSTTVAVVGGAEIAVIANG